MMTVRELISELEQYDGEAQVRLMIQQSWPFQNSVNCVVSLEDVTEPDYGEDEDCEAPHDFYGPVPAGTVYIVEGSQLGYGYKSAWER